MPKGPLELVISGIAAILQDYLMVSAVNGGNSGVHVFVFVVDGVTQVDWEISVVLLFFDDIDGVVETGGKVVLDSGPRSLNIFVVMSFVLEE